MSSYKVNSGHGNQNFVFTHSYKEVSKALERIKFKKGEIIHILGAPGTGKSANICQALDELYLKVYDVKLEVSSLDASSKEVFDMLLESSKKDVQVHSKKELYKRLSEFDAVLIADSFHDSHLQNPYSIGFSQWTDKSILKVFSFFLMCFWEYFSHWRYLRNVNFLFQSSWRIYIRGRKYDLFSELGILSKVIGFILKRIFTVAVISYSEKETVEIVKNHIPQANQDIIKYYIEKHGYKPRFICNDIQNRRL